MVFRTVAAAILCVFMCACGGGGGAPTTSPSTAIGFATDYLVNDPGAVWRYKGVDTRPTYTKDYSNDVRYEESLALGGLSVSRYSRTRPTNETFDLLEYAFTDSAGLWSMATSASGSFSKQAAELEVFEPVVIGTEKVITDVTDATQDFDGDGRRDSLRIVVTARHAAVEPLAVVAGSFASSLRVEKTAVASVTLATGQIVTEAAKQKTWFVKGVGAVKRQLEDPNFSAPSNLVTEELSGFMTNSKVGGTPPPRDFGPAWAIRSDRATPNTLRPVVAASSDHFLIAVPLLDIDAGGLPSNFRIQYGVFSSTGKVISSGVAAAGDCARVEKLHAIFNGQAFWLVWEKSVGFESPPAVRIQRITAEGALLESGSCGKTIANEAGDSAIYVSGSQVWMSWLYPRIVATSRTFLELAQLDSSGNVQAPIARLAELPCPGPFICQSPRTSALVGNDFVFALPRPLQSSPPYNTDLWSYRSNSGAFAKTASAVIQGLNSPFVLETIGGQLNLVSEQGTPAGYEISAIPVTVLTDAGQIQLGAKSVLDTLKRQSGGYSFAKLSSADQLIIAKDIGSGASAEYSVVMRDLGPNKTEVVLAPSISAFETAFPVAAAVGNSKLAVWLDRAAPSVRVVRSVWVFPPHRE